MGVTPVTSGNGGCHAVKICWSRCITIVASLLSYKLQATQATTMAAGFPGNPSCPSGQPDHPP
eukprot:8238715-Pyramimonas_sp.AAC.1